MLAAAMLATLAFVATPAHAKLVDVIEYYNASQDHYFMTSLPEEIAALDAGKIKGWKRTGVEFRANDKAVNGTAPVCRYYIPAEKGDSHFFSASRAECAKVRRQFPSFVEESEAVMHVALPNTKTGECGTREEPVYRMWNGREDSNHRYITSLTLRNQLSREGWTSEGYGPEGVAMCATKSLVEPDPVTAALPPPCKGANSRVMVPNGPHGMYVWSPNAYMLSFLEKDVIGKDPTLCGASLVIFWSAVQPSKGVYDWSAVTTAAKPFTDAGLTVNLLFSEATEVGTANQVTPAWVTQPVSAGGAGAASVSCAGQPTMPVYWDAAYEAAWTTFIAAAIQQFSFNNSPISANVGYMRFATGGGAEALVPAAVTGGGDCQKAWTTTAGYTYEVWMAHELRILNAMGTQPTDKQIMASLAQAPGAPNVYDASNRSAAASAALKVGFSFENLGVSDVADATATPAPCVPTAQLANLHWCQAYIKYAGDVPLATQPITATTNTSKATMDISKLLAYGLANNIQIFELYPEEWLSANSPTWPSFVAANQAKYRQALQTTAQTVGATNGQ